MLLSVTKSCPNFRNPIDYSTPGFGVNHHFLEFTQTQVHWVYDVIQPTHTCRLLLLLPSIFPGLRVFSNELTLHQVANVLSLSFSINPSNEYSGLIFFRIDWFDLLAVQGTLKSLLWHNSSKVLILQRSTFFMVQLSHLHMSTGKIIALTRQDLCWQSDVSAF